MSEWIKRHRLAACFVLAFAISWAFHVPLAASAQGSSGRVTWIAGYLMV